MPVQGPPSRRLGSLNKSALGPRPTGQRLSKPTPTPSAAKKHKCCNDPKVEADDEGQMVCQSCFTQISQANIVADVTFQEDSRGAATVQGGFIGENARYARTLGAAANRLGGGGKNTQQELETTGRRYLNQLTPRLLIPDSTANQAVSLYMLASSHSFAGGRRTEEVVGACLFAACRRKADNAILLIDIAELLKINVFRLGDVYKAMCKEMYLDQGQIGVQHLVNVESLIHRYCSRLQFGNLTSTVAGDATKIAKRMKRDWITPGRHPAGLCGACIILAARMNNFRRSVREMVYVAKVADVTIAKRVEEFRRTRSAALTVEQFRKDALSLKHQADPPVLYESEIRKRKFEEKKQMRREATVARDASVAPIEISDDEDDDDSDTSSREGSVATQNDNGDAPRKRRRIGPGDSITPAPSQQAPRRDADGFLIPALPIDPALTAGEEQGTASPAKRKRGRPKKQAPQPIVITEEEKDMEDRFEMDIEAMLSEPTMVDSRDELQIAKDEEQAQEQARRVAEGQKLVAAQQTKTRRQNEGISWWDDRAQYPPTEEDEEAGVTAEDLEMEFANDPEVQNCRLSPPEQAAKERIWLYYNEDWLRQQAEKELLSKVAGGRNEQGKKRPAKGKPRKRKGKAGDLANLEAAETPVEGLEAVVEKRAPPHFSKHIDYAALARVYQPSDSSRSGSVSLSRAGSETPIASGGATPGGASEVSGGLISPPQTQMQQVPASPSVAGSEMDGSEDDYVEDLMTGGDDDVSEAGWGNGDDDDDREDIGEEDYGRALDPGSRTSLPQDIFGEDEY